MIRRFLSTNIGRKTGISVFVVAFSWFANTPTARAQTAREEDEQTLKHISEWVTSGFNYLDGAITAVNFLTGKQPPAAVTLKAIQMTVKEAINFSGDQKVIDDVNSLSERFRLMAAHTRIFLRPDQGSDNLMGSDFARTYLATTLPGIHEDGRKAFTTLTRVLRLPTVLENAANAQRVARLMPAYTTLVLISAE